MYRIDIKRCREIGVFLKSLPEILEIIDLIEEHDRQYIALRELSRKIPANIATNMVIANALISYFLTGKGEDYWSEFANFLLAKRSFLSEKLKCSDLLALHREFLGFSRFNKLSLRNKYARLEKYYRSNMCVKIMVDPFRYTDDIARLARDLAKITGSRETSKTIVFASKMYWYICRALGRKVSGDIGMPIDRRNAFISLSSGLVKGCNFSIEECVSELISVKYSKLLVRAWETVKHHSGIPLYRLDALTWNIAPHIRYAESPTSAVGSFCRCFPRICDKYPEQIKALIWELGRQILGART